MTTAFVGARLVLLSLSLLLLFAGPLLYLLLQQRPGLLHRVEHFLLILVTLVVIFHLLPESFWVVGWVALLIAGLGWLLPELLERVWRKAINRVDAVSVVLALVGLVVHGTLDGAVLSEPGFTGQALPAMVVLHRLPDSLLIWLLLYPNRGWRLPTFALVIVGLATIMGFAFGEQAISLLKGQVGTDDQKILAYFQALVAGSLLHLSTHKHQHRHAACNTHHHHRH